MTDSAEQGGHRLEPTRREDERVTSLELFFDLVLVLAVTQCTAFMAANLTWTGLADAMVLLALLWWAWGGYAWLTSVVDPEEGFVRLVMFVAMASLLIVALCLPDAFGNAGLTFVIFYALVRGAHLALFMLASRNDATLRKPVSGLAVSTAIGVIILLLGTVVHGNARLLVWLLAAFIDIGGPYIFSAEGWRLVPAHFAERFGLFIILALGESIVALGIGSGHEVTALKIVAAILGVALLAAMWWAYFDVVALVGSRVLVNAQAGKEQNELARDSYSYMHFLMVAGIVFVALGLKMTLAHAHAQLEYVSAFALLGGAGIYLLAHVGFRLRNVKTLNKQRLIVGLAFLVLIPVTHHLAAIEVLTIASTLFAGMVAYEATRFSEGRAEVRHNDKAIPPS